MLPTKFRFIWLSDFRGEYFFQKSTNQKQELPMSAMFLTNRAKMSNLQRGPTMYVSYQVSVHLAKRFQRRRFFRNRPNRSKNCLWRPCLLTNRAEMNNLCSGPSIYASFQVSVHLAKRFQRRRFYEIDQSETRIELPVATMFANGSGRNEPSVQRTLHR